MAQVKGMNPCASFSICPGVAQAMESTGAMHIKHVKTGLQQALLAQSSNLQMYMHEAAPARQDSRIPE